MDMTLEELKEEKQKLMELIEGLRMELDFLEEKLIFFEDELSAEDEKKREEYLYALDDIVMNIESDAEDMRDIIDSLM